MTVVIPSIVNDVSAIDVAKTTFLLPLASGIIASLCLSNERSLYKGHSDTSRFDASKDSRVLFISKTPGKKTSMSPVCSFQTFLIAFETETCNSEFLSST
jgi:hypothetical protein